jgi:hypothetical protein
MDYYIQYEKLSEGIKFVCDKLSIPFEENSIPRLKSGIRNTQIPIREFYSNECIDIINSSFPWEIERFKYQLQK